MMISPLLRCSRIRPWLVGSGSCVVTLALVAAGCGPGGAGAIAVNGNVRGQPTLAVDNAAGSAVFPGTTSLVGAIVLSDRTGICAAFSGNVEPRSLRAVSIFVGQRASGGSGLAPPAGPGVYALGGGPSEARVAFLNVTQRDPACTLQDALGASATSGSVTLTRVSGGSYAGTFEASLDSGDALSGSFDALSCSGVGAFLNGSLVGCE